jgi:8-oxo-dGTP diphosphatase
MSKFQMFTGNTANKRHTGRAIVIKDNHILLLERWRDNLHYFSIPGGGIEQGENAAETAVREVKEETDVDITIERLIYELNIEERIHSFFLARYISGEPHLPLDSPEAHAGNNNRYLPRWIPVRQIPELDLGYWRPLHSYLVRDIKNGFSKSVKITAA